MERVEATVSVREQHVGFVLQSFHREPYRGKLAEREVRRNVREVDARGPDHNLEGLQGLRIDRDCDGERPIAIVGDIRPAEAIDPFQVVLFHDVPCEAELLIPEVAEQRDRRELIEQPRRWDVTAGVQRALGGQDREPVAEDRPSVGTYDAVTRLHVRVVHEELGHRA